MCVVLVVNVIVSAVVQFNFFIFIFESFFEREVY